MLHSCLLLERHQPTADVTVPLGSSRPGEGALSVASLTFTPLNWGTPQAVTHVRRVRADGIGRRPPMDSDVAAP